MYDVKEFIKKVEITRETGDTCEFEVCKKAMDKYIEYYLCYEGWEKKETSYSEKSRSGYKGSYELCKDDKILTADIITSIKAPVNRTLKKIGCVQFGSNGENIRGKILEGKSDEYMKILPYFTCFSIVYYWIGNMMPVISNPNRGMSNIDNWNEKITQLRNSFKNEVVKNKGWRKEWDWWIKDLWGDKGFKDFINSYCLQDMVELSNNEYIVKNIVNKKNSITVNWDIEDIKKWYINNTKLIIQRSYRIVYGYDGEWNEESFKPVNIIMRDVFKIAGISDDLAKNYSESPF